jgi:hypothetical protein
VAEAAAEVLTVEVAALVVEVAFTEVLALTEEVTGFTEDVAALTELEEELPGQVPNADWHPVPQ